MEKFMTKADLDRFENIIGVPYGNLQYLLKGAADRKCGYNAGKYGWNYDVYYINYNSCLVTGYRLPKVTALADANTCLLYNAAAYKYAVKRIDAEAKLNYYTALLGKFVKNYIK